MGAWAETGEELAALRLLAAVMLLGSLGLMLDVRAHVDGTDDIFSLWHVVLGGSFLATAAVGTGAARVSGDLWWTGIARVGAALAGLLVLDQFWHVFVGVEAGSDVFLSPTHLGLFWVAIPSSLAMARKATAVGDAVTAVAGVVVAAVWFGLSLGSWHPLLGRLGVHTADDPMAGVLVLGFFVAAATLAILTSGVRPWVGLAAIAMADGLLGVAYGWRSGAVGVPAIAASALAVYGARTRTVPTQFAIAFGVLPAVLLAEMAVLGRLDWSVAAVTGAPVAAGAAAWATAWATSNHPARPVA